MRASTRREILASAAGGGAVALAGCVADDDEQASDDDGKNGADEGDAGANEGLELVEATLRERSLENGEGGFTAAVDDGELVVEGRIAVPTPCHEPVLTTETFEDGELSLVVGTEEASGDEDCPQVVVDVGYEVTVAFSDALADLSAFERVSVEHDVADGGVHHVVEDGEVTVREPDGDDDGDDGTDDVVLESSITTTDADCAGGDVGDAESELEYDDEIVTVSGSVVVPNPCHEAVLKDARVDDGVLAVTVGVRSTLGPNEVCIECVGAVTYEARITLANAAAVSDVAVTHEVGERSDRTPVGERR